MFNNWIVFLSTLLTTDISVYIGSKGKVVNRKEKQRNNSFLRRTLGQDKKKTKIHLSVLFCNIFFYIIYVITSFGDCDKHGQKITIFNFLGLFVEHITKKHNELLILVIITSLITCLFIFLIYKGLDVEKPNDNKGNQILSVEEIDKKYIDFSLPNNIDSHSELLLIAGDLSFFGELPNITNASSRKKSRCVHHLSNNKQDHSFCNGKKCPSQISNCIESSSQFEQLFKLVEKGVTIRVICKHPANSTDIQYKRRLGRLKSIYKDSMEIKFFPEETLSDDFCVLGRIKKNGGIKELFWHWKAPGRAGYYTVPETLRATTSDNITIIYLFEEVLWNYAKEDTKVIDESIELYNEYIDEIK